MIKYEHCFSIQRFKGFLNSAIIAIEVVYEITLCPVTPSMQLYIRISSYLAMYAVLFYTMDSSNCGDWDWLSRRDMIPLASL